MQLDYQNLPFQIALDYVTKTSRQLFLSGKAGTGKTTFLKTLKEICTKNSVVVAPTGVAAINAGGVTIHSFFQLPFGPFIPGAQTGFGMHTGIVDTHTLLKNIRLQTSKRKILLELELLIIDEISMVRSDMLDAIDTILRYVRKNQQPFGGIQVLFIGDLYQLPPVVKDTEKIQLDAFYASPFFFDAKVIPSCNLINIELTKIYRQKEINFIHLLNKVRHNTLEELDYIQLNSRYNPAFSNQENKFITLTTHNHKADAINNTELKKLSTSKHVFTGKLKGDFNEKQLPTELVLSLKIGAQVMFIKNDSSFEKRYYNGKIVEITKIEEDDVYVRLNETLDEFLVPTETWENISYELNKETNAIEEKIVGQFIQLPLRLAWAITIHKSQGLTFENAIIDAGNSFSPGQVYVALSRCTSLEGIVLQTPIHSHAISTDARIAAFDAIETDLTVLQQQLTTDNFRYETQKIITLFSWQPIVDIMVQFYELTRSNKSLPFLENASAMCEELHHKAKAQLFVAEKFTNQLHTIIQSSTPNNKQAIMERTQKGITYFMEVLHTDIFLPFQEFRTSLIGKSKLKKYSTALLEYEDLLWKKIHALQTYTFNGESMIKNTLPIQRKSLTQTAKKVEKGSSAKESLAYFVAGKSIEEISTIRGMAHSTIEGHLAGFIKTGELEIERFFSKEQLNTIQIAVEEIADKSLNALYNYFHGTFSYGELRIAQNYFMYLLEKKEAEL